MESAVSAGLDGIVAAIRLSRIGKPDVVAEGHPSAAHITSWSSAG